MTSFETERRRLVENLRADPALGRRSAVGIDAIAVVARELFVPPRFAELAYADEALQLAPGATISAPSMVAAMVAALRPAVGLRVLEIGSGSGYAAAVMAAAGLQVTGVEILPALVRSSRQAIARAGFAPSVAVHEGDGNLGWPAGAPFDRLVVSAAVPAVPLAWMEQVAVGGLLVYPESGDREWDMLVRLERGPRGWTREELQACKFVPLRNPGRPLP